MSLGTLLRRPIRGRLEFVSTSGSAAVEFAVVLPVMMALVAGALNYGVMGLQMSTLISASRGGAEYAKSNPSESSSNLAAHTKTATGVPSTTTVTASLTCRCMDNTTPASCPTPGTTNTTTSTNPCAAKSDPRLIYSVQVRTTQNTQFSLGTLSFSSLSATAKIRFD